MKSTISPIRDTCKKVTSFTINRKVRSQKSDAASEAASEKLIADENRGWSPRNIPKPRYYGQQVREREETLLDESVKVKCVETRDDAPKGLYTHGNYTKV